MQYAELQQYERSDYPYSVSSRRESVSANKEKLDAIRRESYGVTFKEAISSDVLSGYIPDLFADEILTLGQRVAIARNNFPVVGQSTHGSFKQRYRWREEGTQVTGKELVEVKHTQGERDTREFSFLKLMDSNVLSQELIEDSTLDEVTTELQLSANKFYRRENQLMAHRLTEWSQGATYAQQITDDEYFGNWIDGVDSSSDDDDLIAAMELAYLAMTTRLHDAFPVESLTWFVSPEVYARLFRLADFRRWDIMGASPTLTTGKVNVDDRIFRIPIQIWEPGFFDSSSVWTPQAYDIFLVAPQFAAAIRERWSMRTSPLDMQRILAQALMLWERLIPYVRHPYAFCRISPTQTYSNLIGDMGNIHIIAKQETDETIVLPGE